MAVSGSPLCHSRRSPALQPKEDIGRGRDPYENYSPGEDVVVIYVRASEFTRALQRRVSPRPDNEEKEGRTTHA